MRKKFMCEFLNVSRPFQQNWAWRGAGIKPRSLIAKYYLSWEHQGQQQKAYLTWLLGCQDIPKNASVVNCSNNCLGSLGSKNINSPICCCVTQRSKVNTDDTASSPFLIIQEPCYTCLGFLG
jgi:hypothetical protein